MLTDHQIAELVEEFGIDQQTNKRPIAYKRFYLAHYLREKAKVGTLQKVADLVGYKKHDNVVYAIKQHNNLKRDPYYKTVTSELVRAIECMEQDIKREQPTLIQRVLMCEDYWQMHKLQQDIRKGMYVTE